jgi:transcription factor TFIIIB component B''
VPLVFFLLVGADRLPADISTLSRLTGKDFSGPTPIIRGPTPLEFPEEPAHAKDSAPAPAAKAPAKAKRKKSKTQALAPDEEIVGAADTFVDEDDA